MTDTHKTQVPAHSRAERWEEWSSWPLLILSLGFVALSTVVLADNHIEAGAQSWATFGMLLMWAFFLLDFAIRLKLTEHRWQYVRGNLFEAVTLALPFLRAFLLVLYLWRLPLLKRSRAHQRLRFMLVAASFGLVFVYVASTLVWLAEHQAPGANIRSFGDAIWWGFATIATVGYGDYTPVTVPGRVIAVGLMLGGIIIVGIVTATVMSSLTEQVQRGAGARAAESAGMATEPAGSGSTQVPTANEGESQRGQANQDGDLQP